MEQEQLQHQGHTNTHELHKKVYAFIIMDKINNGVNYFIDKYAKEQTLSVLCAKYKSLEDGEQKKQYYESIKALLIEIYGVNSLLQF